MNGVLADFEGLRVLGTPTLEAALAVIAESGPHKIVLAGALGANTSVSNAWSAACLVILQRKMGTTDFTD